MISSGEEELVMEEEETDSNDVSTPIANESIKTSLQSNDTTVIKEHEFSVKLVDENGTGIANKTIKFTLNKVVSEVLTDDDGIAKLKVTVNPGTYTIKYSTPEFGISILRTRLSADDAPLSPTF